MRTHLQIIADAGGYQKVAEALSLRNERVRFWQKRESIPSEWWGAVAGQKLATLKELADAADARKRSSVEAA